MIEYFKIAYDCRNADSTRFWTMFGLMTTVNGVLLTFVVTRQIAAESDTLLLWLFAGIIGVLVCSLWLRMQTRYRWWCNNWDKKLIHLEPLVKEEINADRRKAELQVIPDSFQLFEKEGETKPQGLSTREGPCYMAGVFLVAWLLFFLTAFCKLICQ